MLSLKHAFTSGKPASADSALVDGPKWDAEHILTLTALSVLGRSGATGGAAEEITAGSDGHVLFRSGMLLAFGQLGASAVSFAPTGSIVATDVQAAIVELDSDKLAASAYTATDVLAKLLTVDGSGSGLDADLLDGQASAATRWRRT